VDVAAIAAASSPAAGTNPAISRSIQQKAPRANGALFFSLMWEADSVGRRREVAHRRCPPTFENECIPPSAGVDCRRRSNRRRRHVMKLKVNRSDVWAATIEDKP